MTNFSRGAIAIILLVAVAGCSLQTASDRSVAAWRSPDSSLDQRMEAASQLVPTGTTQAKAERILGAPPGRKTFYGPVFYAPGWPGYVSATNVARCNIRQDIYNFADGDFVALSFDMGAPRHEQKEARLLGISIGNTNVDVFTLTPGGTNKF